MAGADECAGQGWSNVHNAFVGGVPMSETFDVVVRRTFPVAPAEAWRAWSESDLVKQWWGPDGFSCPMADVDLRVGGRTFVAMRAPAEFGGGDLYSTWNFTEVVPHSRIAYVFNFADPQGNRVLPADLGIPPGVPDDGEHGYTNEETHNISQVGLEQCVDKMAAIYASSS